MFFYFLFFYFFFYDAHLAYIMVGSLVLELSYHINSCVGQAVTVDVFFLRYILFPLVCT